MRESTSDDSDSEYQYSKINPEWLDQQKKGHFHDEKWPNTAPLVNGKTSDKKLPKPNIENVRKMIRYTLATNTKQNGCKDNVPGVAPETIAKVTIDMPNLAQIVADARRPQLNAPVPHSQPLSRPPPPLQSPPPPHQLPQPPPNNIVSIV